MDNNRSYRSDSTRAAVREALDRLDDRGRKTYGTHALVESLVLHLGCTRKALAKMAGVSVESLRNWTTDDKALGKNLIRIRALATHEAGDAETSEGAGLAPEPVDNVGTEGPASRAIGDALTYVPLKKIQTALGNPIRNVLTDKFGMEVLSCRISKFETDGLAVRLTFTIN